MCSAGKSPVEFKLGNLDTLISFLKSIGRKSKEGFLAQEKKQVWSLAALPGIGYSVILAVLFGQHIRLINIHK